MGTHFFYDEGKGKAIDIKNAIIAYKEKISKIFQDTNITHDTIDVNFGMDVEAEGDTKAGIKLDGNFDMNAI